MAEGAIEQWTGWGALRDIDLDRRRVVGELQARDERGAGISTDTLVAPTEQEGKQSNQIAFVQPSTQFEYKI